MMANDSDAAAAMPGTASCPCCGLLHAQPPTPVGWVARCPRCATALPDRRSHALASSRTAAVATAALLLYPLAVSLPLIRIERFGQYHESSVWHAAVALFARGNLVVGLVILLCSLVIPLVKLLALLLLSLAGDRLSDRHRARTYRVVDLIGRWGMVDVLLLAVMVATLKLGDLVQVAAGPGALAFTLMVVLSLLASACFDPRSLWVETTAKPRRAHGR